MQRAGSEYIGSRDVIRGDLSGGDACDGFATPHRAQRSERGMGKEMIVPKLET